MAPLLTHFAAFLPAPGAESVACMLLFSAHINTLTLRKHTLSWIAEPRWITCACTYTCTCTCPYARIYTSTLLNWRLKHLSQPSASKAWSPSASGKITLFSWWQLPLVVEAYINGQSCLSQLSDASGVGRSTDGRVLAWRAESPRLIPNTWMCYYL